MWVRSGKIPWRRAWQPTPMFLPGESYGQRSLAGYSPWGRRVGHDRSDLACTYHLFPDKERIVNWPHTPACRAEFSKGLAHLCFGFCFVFFWGLPGGSDGKASACNVGDLGSIPRLGRSPGEGNGNPLQYSCLESSMDGGACGLQSMGSQRAGHNWVASFFFCFLIHDTQYTSF